MKKFKIKILLFCLLTITKLNFCLEQKIILTSIPKCGTHLLFKCIYLLNSYVSLASYNLIYLESHQICNLEKNICLISHAFCNEKNKNLINLNNLKGFFIYRDPRDQIVSMIHQVYKYPISGIIEDLKKYSFDDLFFKLIENYGEIFYRQWNITFGPSWKLIYQEKISAQEKNETITNIYQKYLNWKNESSIYTTKFENLVGPKGGGTEEKQLNEIINIAKHMGIKINFAEAKNIANNLFGDSGTFREGKIGSWKKYFKKEHKEAFKKVAGQLLIDLGYEKDLNW